MAWSDAARRAALETRRRRRGAQVITDRSGVKSYWKEVHAAGDSGRRRGGRKLMTTGLLRMGSVSKEERTIMQQGWKKAQTKSWASSNPEARKKIMSAYSRVAKWRKQNLDPYSRR